MFGDDREVEPAAITTLRVALGQLSAGELHRVAVQFVAYIEDFNNTRERAQIEVAEGLSVFAASGFDTNR